MSRSSVCFFDLETKYSFDDIQPNYSTLRFDEKETLRSEIVLKMQMSTSCVIDSNGKIYFFDEGDEIKLIKILDSYKTIIGHNILRFDYPVLNTATKMDVAARYKSKTVDTLEKLRIATGKYISLDNLALSNKLDIQKTLKGSEAPTLWRNGEKQKVRNYCKNDVEILKAIYELGKRDGRIRCSITDNGKEQVKIVEINW